MLHSTTPIALLAAAALGTSIAGAAVVTNPALVGGADAMDPAGNETVNTEYGATMASLEADPTFRAIQDFTGFDATAVNGESITNIFNFTSPSVPDIRITITGSTGVGTGGPLGGVYQSSDGAGMKITGSSNSATVTISFDFGDYDAQNETFTPGGAVASVGWVLNAHRSGIRYTADFYNAANDLLGSVGPTSGANEGDSYADVSMGFIGGNTPATAISRVVILREGVGGTPRGTTSQGLDDLGFAVVPEPASLSLIGLGGLALLRRRR